MVRRRPLCRQLPDLRTDRTLRSRRSRAPRAPVSARPHAHLPPMLLAGVHYLLLDGGEHSLADVYSGRSTASPAPLFRDLCLDRRDDLLEILNARTVQTNEVGRSALLGAALTWAAADEERVQLVDVGCSAGINLLCDRFRLDYGRLGATGPEDSPVQVDCSVSAGVPPIASRLPVIGAGLASTSTLRTSLIPTTSVGCWPASGRAQGDLIEHPRHSKSGGPIHQPSYEATLWRFSPACSTTGGTAASSCSIPGRTRTSPLSDAESTHSC